MVCLLVYVVFIDVNVQPWDPQYEANPQLKLNDSDDTVLWFNPTHPDFELYGAFRSKSMVSKEPRTSLPDGQTTTEGRENEFLSLYRNEGFKAFMARFRKCNKEKLLAMMDGRETASRTKRVPSRPN